MEAPTHEELEAALAVLRRCGGVVGALMICDDRLRKQFQEQREMVLGLEARISDLENRLNGSAPAPAEQPPLL